MAGQFEAKDGKRGRPLLKIAWGLVVLALLILLAVGLCAVWEQITPGETTAPTLTQPTTTAPPETAVPPTAVPPTTVPPTQPPIVKESTATIGSTGDILLHKKVIQSGYSQETGTYNYDSAFSVFSSFVSKMDYAVANLEVTLCGNENGYEYSGYPCFNAPDAIADALKNAGFDMLLTANNHCFDTRTTGLLRTQEILRNRELDYTGTRYTEEEKNYLVKEINGIKIGMICYTYNTGVDENGAVSLNGIPLTAEATRLVNSFDYGNLDAFYTKLSAELSAMRGDGAEAVMVYLHWGDEYDTTPNATQKKVAQALCDMGVEVIVGNHAHVPQPVELLTNSQDESKKTLCLYSMGNALSNIRRGPSYPTETEDGMLFQVTFAKYSDGTVVVESVDVLPTWVNRYTEDGVMKFQILAMDNRDKDNWQTSMNLTEELLEECRDSYERTMEIVGSGLETANAYFRQHQQEVEAIIGVTG